MPTLPSLKKTFRRALAAAIAAGPVVTGCGPGPGIEKDPDFVAARCENGTNLWLPDLKPEPPVDFLELVGGTGNQSQGEACKTASMVQACQAKLGTLREMAEPVARAALGFRIVNGVDHIGNAALLVTRGDDAFMVDSETALRALLGEIDTPAEAMLLSQVGGYNLECDRRPGARPSAEGFEVQAYQTVGCGGRDRYLIAVDRAGNVEELDHERIKDPQRGCAVGRRPAGLRDSAQPPCSSAGAYLARAATLEAASVAAFRCLAAELAAHGAPSSLIEAALTAARDEVRHARVTARLAQRWGARPARPQIDPTPARSLEEIARENASEGCVRETFGALEGRWMALHASDARVRQAYRRIAEDELRHAALSWRIARWIEPRLSAAQQKRVNAARTFAIDDLARALATEPSAEIRALCGVPSAREASDLFRELRPALA